MINVYVYTIYIYRYIRDPKDSQQFTCAVMYRVCLYMTAHVNCNDSYPKARTITSGETPQKSLILPPVHTFIKVLVAPVNLMFS